MNVFKQSEEKFKGKKKKKKKKLTFCRSKEIKRWKKNLQSARLLENIIYLLIKLSGRAELTLQYK